MESGNIKNIVIDRLKTWFLAVFIVLAKLRTGLQPYQFLSYSQWDHVYIITTSLSFLSEGFKGFFVLSCFFCFFFFLLCVPYRPDGHQNNLRSSAYESLMEIVKNSAKDCYPAVQKTTLVIMERLQQVLQMEVSLQAS